MSGISVVITTFNSEKFIRSCLDSVLAQGYSESNSDSDSHRDFEVIVVDNGSQDATSGIIKKDYPQIVLIENKKNLGASKARNQGIAIAKGKWILILDCDTVLEKGFFKEMVTFAKISQDSIGAFQPKILNTDRRTIYSCGIYLSRLRRFYDIGKGKLDYGQFSTCKHILGACSAAAFYRRQMLEDIKEETGYFDERLFFLAEDVDLAWRAQKRGWRAIFCPKAICYHFGNSSGFDKKFKQYLCWRNRIFILKKSKLSRLKLFAIALLYDLPRVFFLFLTNTHVRNAIRNKRI